MIHFSLFSGIGGFELAAQWMGWKNYVSCEIDDFCNKVRKYYWPDCWHHDNVKTLTFELINEKLSEKYGKDWRNDDIVLTGGFPCQPYSSAGKRLGKDDERHLWPEMLRIICEVKPTYIVGENVYGLLNWNGGMVFEEVCADLENNGYEVQPVLLPASGIGAPHHRGRIWFVAYAKNRRINGINGNDNGEKKKNRTGHDKFNGIGKQQYASDTDGNESQRNCGADTSTAEEIRRDGKGNVFGELCSNGDATDTECFRLEHTTKERDLGNCKSKTFCERSKLAEPIETNGINGDAADTDGIGLRRKSDGIGISGQYGENSKGNDWQNFPTKSPICGGDDGISHRLDGITFSSWRKKSLQAYGNAIVPQLAFIIFQTIVKTKQNEQQSTGNRNNPCMD